MYTALRNEIDTIQIIDNHAHPGFALYFDSIPQQFRTPLAVDGFKTPSESSAGFPYQEALHYEAYEKLYGFSRADIDNPDKRTELSSVYEEQRNNLPSFIDKAMDQGGVEKIIVNFVIPKCLKGKKNILFIPVIDPLVLPFDNSHLENRPMALTRPYSYLLQQLKDQYHYEEKGFSHYLEFIDQVLQGYLDEGCVGFKFAIAYARTTYFENVPVSEGESLYPKAMAGDLAAYHRLQDLLVWYIMRKIVQFDVPVQYHFAIIDNHIRCFKPSNLANMLEDSELSNAKIVILHGGYPSFLDSETMALGGLSPNYVHIDFSGRIMFANHPKIIAKMLRTWLEKPALWNKLIYGSDTLWGERYIYTCSKTGRDGVYYALESMIDDGIIDEETAIGLARKLLRDNALRLYRLEDD